MLTPFKSPQPRIAAKFLYGEIRPQTRRQTISQPRLRACKRRPTDAQTAPKASFSSRATPNRVHSALKSARKASYAREIAAFSGRDAKTMRCEDKSPRQARIPLQIYGAGINFAFKIKLQKRKLRCRLNPPQARTALKRHKILPRPKRLNRATSEPNFIAAQRQNFTKRRRLVTR